MPSCGAAIALVFGGVAWLVLGLALYSMLLPSKMDGEWYWGIDPIYPAKAAALQVDALCVIWLSLAALTWHAVVAALQYRWSWGRHLTQVTAGCYLLVAITFSAGVWPAPEQSVGTLVVVLASALYALVMLYCTYAQVDFSDRAHE